MFNFFFLSLSLSCWESFGLQQMPFTGMKGNILINFTSGWKVSSNMIMVEKRVKLIFDAQLKPLNVITLVYNKSDNNNRLWLLYWSFNKSDSGLYQTNYINRMIALTVITLSGFCCNIKVNKVDTWNQQSGFEHFLVWPF